MKEQLVNYHIFNIITKEKNVLLGLSEEQTDAFAFEFDGVEKSPSSIHLSHFILGAYKVVYNNSYVLKPEEVVYLFNDIGGNWNNDI